jgi:hypothetical protein
MKTFYSQFVSARLVAVALAAFLSTNPAFAADKKPILTLIDANITPRILVAPSATESEKYAALELAQYLGKMSGKAIEPITSDDSLESSAASPLIVVGHHPLNQDLQPGQLELEESVISIEPNRVRIVGGKQEPIASTVRNQKVTFVRDRGTLYGVYNFLDDLGVRWYRPDPWGEYVPQKNEIVLEQGRTVDRPAFKYRMGANLYRWWTDQTPEQREWIARWIARNRINTESNPTRLDWAGGKYGVRAVHSHFSYLSPGKFFKDHPEYFALIDGKRVNNKQLCLSNPTVEKIVGNAIVAMAKREPHIDFFPLDPNDGMGYCECEPCRAMDDPNLLARNGRDKRLGNASMSNRVNIFNNKIAKRLAEEVPGKGAVWLAYLTFSEVPTKITKFEPNALVAPASIAAAYGDYSKLLNDPTSSGNVNLKELYEGYSKTGAKMGAHEYWLGGWWYGPMPLLTVMKDRLTNYRKYGVEWVYSETHSSWGPHGLITYMYARLLWNPDLDIEKELEEYCRNFYGPAAAPMLEYHRMLEKASLEGKPWFHLGVRLGNLFMNDTLVERMGTLMDQATTAVKGQQPYERRVNGDWAGYEVVRRFNLAMKYKSQNDALKAISTWDELEAFLTSPESIEIFDSGPYFFPLSWKYQSNAYGITALRRQIDSLKKNPGSKTLMNLDEDWKFSPDPQKQGEKRGVHKPEFNDQTWPLVKATMDWQSQGHSYQGTAWYRKKMNIAQKEQGKKYLLFFGAVDGDATVFVNGEKVGEHLLGPGYANYDKEFMIDITQVLKAGDNTIVVKVTKDFAIGGITKGVSLVQM